MAQISTPPAGWYTDPSGQHRARYWDGASWTEQVRDDVVEPSPSAGGDGVHRAAATVAGVAQAVAAVAAPAGGDPSFVVDYGGAWDVAADPTTTAAPAAAPVQAAPVEPAPVHWSPIEMPPVEPAPVQAAPVQAPPVQAPPVQAPPVQPTPPAPPAPVSGPPPAWYPDPAGRHQARFWDGTRWTERVADNGLEGFDPAVSAPVATSAESAAAAGGEAATGWSAQLLGGTDTDGAIPPLFGAHGDVSMTAGQASLAALADADPALDEALLGKARTRPGGKVYVAGWLVVVGAVSLLAGSALPWMRVRGPGVDDAATATGINLGDGRFTIALAIVLAVLGAGIVTGRMTKVGGVKVAAMGALVAGVAAIAVTAVDIADVADRAERLGVPAAAVSDVGLGLWICFGGALLTVAGGLMAFANRH